MKAVIKIVAVLFLLPCCLTSCRISENKEDEEQLAPAIALVIARDAYLYGYPMVENYKTMYLYAIKEDNPEYKAPFNEIHNVTKLYSPEDKAVVSPNSDTPYSMLWMDLRAEPIVLTMPKMDADRYFSVQLVDLFTYNFGYIGTRTTGNNGGSYLIAGPNWKGDTPKGIDQVFQAETDFVFAIYRTQLINPEDMEKVKRIQSGYKAIPLHSFLGQPAPPSAPQIQFPPYDATQAQGLDFFNYLSFLLQFAPTVPAEKKLRDSFTQIGVAPGKAFNPDQFSSEVKNAMEDGIEKAKEAMTDEITQMESSAIYFGSREFLGSDYLRRAVAAKVGIYGNSKEEALYHIYKNDSDGTPLNGADQQYLLRFPPNGLPPVDAFWSVTMYDAKTQLLVENPINRYLINSPMLGELVKDPDGGITIYIQSESPGKEKEKNWLPAPNDSFYLVMRLYLPQSDDWKPPKLTISSGRE